MRTKMLFAATALAVAALVGAAVLRAHAWALVALGAVGMGGIALLYWHTARRDGRIQRFLAKRSEADVRLQPGWREIPYGGELSDVIDEYINRIKEEGAVEEHERQATLQALQSQINPHFIYNTLECIRGQALLDGNRSIADMLEALGNFFRYSISRRENIVTLADEIANIESYMLIQDYRFLSRYHFQITFLEEEEPLLGCYVPKLTLQPIVENALLHGFENRKTGCITLQVDATDEVLLLTVSDDGAGMDASTLEALNAKIESKQESLNKPTFHGNGIALQNVNRRIRMLFGREYGLHAYSTSGRGTDIEIILPRVTQTEAR